MLNSVKAFIIGKQKACKIVDKNETYTLVPQVDEELELAKQKRQSELYDIMISMADAKLEINDIKNYIHEQKRLKLLKEEEIEREKRRVLGKR